MWQHHGTRRGFDLTDIFDDIATAVREKAVIAQRILDHIDDLNAARHFVMIRMIDVINLLVHDLTLQSLQ